MSVGPAWDLRVSGSTTKTASQWRFTHDSGRAVDSYYVGSMPRGIVKFFKSSKGWGAITSDELADGQDAFVHFSVIESGGYRAWDGGDIVDFDYETARQDIFHFRAISLR